MPIRSWFRRSRWEIAIVATAKAFVGTWRAGCGIGCRFPADALKAYVDAIEKAFGADVDFGQIVKTYGHEEVSDESTYSAPKFVSAEKNVMTGTPDDGPGFHQLH